MTYEELRRGMISTKDPVRIQYNTKDQYKRTAKLLGLMDDFKVKCYSHYLPNVIIVKSLKRCRGRPISLT